jgi:hypothetical protein
MKKTRANASNAPIAPNAPDKKRVRTVGDARRDYLVKGYVTNPTRTHEFAVIRRMTGPGSERVMVRDRASYEAECSVRREQVQVSRNAKKSGPQHEARQVKRSRAAFRQFCIRHNLFLFFTVTQSRKGTRDMEEFVGMLQRFTRLLTPAGVHPWAAVWEQSESQGWHGHVAVSRPWDSRLMKRLWDEAAGECAGHVERPKRKLDPKTKRPMVFLPEKVAAYLSKDFDKVPNPAGLRVRRFLPSRPLKGERYDKTPKVGYLSAATLEEALVGAVDVSQGLDFAWVSRDHKREQISVETVAHKVRGQTGKNARAAYARAAMTALRKKYWPR